MTRCFSCRTELPDDQPFHRTEQCPNCRADLRVCRNCTFYDPSVQWECREHISEPVRDKERANFCDFFRPRSDRPEDAGAPPRQAEAEEARSKFNKLFGD